MKKINILLCTVFVVVVTACNGNAKSDKINSSKEVARTEDKSLKRISLTDEQYRLAEIEIGKIYQADVSNIVKLNGVIEAAPQNRAMVSAPLGGYVKSEGFILGQEIKRGQVVAVLENKEFIDLQQLYLQSNSKYEYLKEEYSRQQKLRESNVNSVKVFQQTTADLQSIKAQMEGIGQTLSLAGINIRQVLMTGKIQRTARLYAPISGYVRTSNIIRGMYINPNDMMLEIVNMDEIYVLIKAFDKDLNTLEVGQNVKFCLSNENLYNRSARVAVLGRSLSSDNTIPVTCTINDSNKQGLLPGSFVKAWVETSPKKQTVVPSSAIVNYDGNDYIVILTNSTASKRDFLFCQITRGITQEGLTAVILPSDINIRVVDVVIKNAYTILSTLINSEER